MRELELMQVGTETGVVLPEEMLTRLGVDAGAELSAVAVRDVYLLTVLEPEVVEQLERGREFVGEHRDVFGALADCGVSQG